MQKSSIGRKGSRVFELFRGVIEFDGKGFGWRNGELGSNRWIELFESSASDDKSEYLLV